jgi:hypothetical protein
VIEFHSTAVEGRAAPPFHGTPRVSAEALLASWLHMRNSINAHYVHPWEIQLYLPVEAGASFSLADFGVPPRISVAVNSCVSKLRMST